MKGCEIRKNLNFGVQIRPKPSKKAKTEQNRMEQNRMEWSRIQKEWNGMGLLVRYVQQLSST